MFINNFIYFHISICILLIVFEIFWVQYMKIHKKKLKNNTIKYIKHIREQLNYIETNNDNIQTNYCKILFKKLKNINNLMAFEKAYSELLEEKNIKIYTKKIVPTFVDLGIYYSKRKDDTKKAYFAYIIGTYFKNLDSNYATSMFIKILYKFLESKSIYCKINSMNAIYNIGNTSHIIRAISNINKNEYTYNQILLVKDLKNVKQDKQKLAEELFKRFDKYNKNIQITIIKFLSDYPYIDENLLIEKLKDSYTLIDVKCEIMRYFQKHKNEKLKEYLITKLNIENIVANDLNIKAIGTLGYYEEQEVFNLLNKLKESTDNLIKESAYRSLEKIKATIKNEIILSNT